MGATPKYKTPQEMQKKIDSYFKSCEGRMLKDKNREPIADKYGRPIYVGRKHYTVTGLALYLGFKSRQALLNYQTKSAAFNDTLTRAKMKIEQHAEELLFDRDACNGAKFSLQNNFGWKEKQEIEQNGDSNINVNIKTIK